ncbi:MAG: SLBB domain-containing protein [Planctomycetes bacterium]|nr:SLBB domain-containing protein [Planctomycetota bacterium]MCB9902955.1 SLBB domain-containing protein [Planctomycetota bacterium]
MSSESQRADVPDRLQAAGGLRPGAAAEVARETGQHEADVFGVASFFDLLRAGDRRLAVCTGLSCRMRGADAVLAAALQAGLPVREAACLAACDRAPAVLKDRVVLPEVEAAECASAGNDWRAVRPGAEDEAPWRGTIWPSGPDPERLALDLAGPCDFGGAASERARELGADAVIDAIEAAGLQGRGGAGFPAHIKWRGVAGQAQKQRYVVLNADESEPGTFKDREVLLRRPDLVVEGLAIAARAVGANEIYCYLRGEFELPRRELQRALDEARSRGLYADLHFHMHAGQGAYICGEETALLEALEGKRGMPRLKPPFPVEVGLWGKPTLIHNVETIACVPSIVLRGGAWFKALGRTGAGTKLYCLSGDVAKPGVYELPLGATLDELLEAGGGVIGELKAFSPGGASSGFLPASESARPLDFKALAEVDSMLGSAGVVVLNTTRDLKDAALDQLRFFSEESCGQCAPCRIGTRYQHEALKRHVDAGGDGAHLEHVARVAHEMVEGSICGLGMTAALPLTSAMRWFPGEFPADD